MSSKNQHRKYEDQIRKSQQLPDNAPDTMLALEKEKMCNILENITEGVLVQDFEGKVLYINKNLAKLIGIPLKQLQVMSVQQIVQLFSIYNEKKEPVLYQDLPGRLSVKNKEVVEKIVCFHHKKKGYEIWALVKAVPVLSKDNTVDYTITTYTDVTSLKKTEEQLQKNQERYETFFENGLDAIFITNKEGQIVDVNATGCKMLGLPRDKIIGTSGARFTAENLEPKVREEIIKEFERKGFWYGESSLKRSNGEVIFVELWAEKDFMPGYTYIIARDITDRKEAEKALQTLTVQLEEQALTLEAILSSTTNHIYVVNRKGEYIYVNTAVMSALGKSPEEIIGKKGKQVGFPADYVAIMNTLRNEVFTTGEVRKVECRLMTVEGERYFEYLLSPIRDKDGKVILVVKTATDITERKELEERKDEFLGIASHELKTPLTSIKGYTQILQKKFQEKGDKEVLRHITRVDSQLNRLTNLVRDLLDISKIDTGKIRLEKDAFNLKELILEIVEEFEHLSYSHEIIVKEEESMIVYADRYRIGQVLINLFSNAIKYSPKSDKIVVTVAQQGDMAVVSVKDFGIGISREVQPKIFERFYQMNLKNGEKFSGLGLGLYISSEIVTRHGGRIWVESERGKGSVFSFSLPIFECEKVTLPSLKN